MICSLLYIFTWEWWHELAEWFCFISSKKWTFRTCASFFDVQRDSKIGKIKILEGLLDCDHPLKREFELFPQAAVTGRLFRGQDDFMFLSSQVLSIRSTAISSLLVSLEKIVLILNWYLSWRFVRSSNFPFFCTFGNMFILWMFMLPLCLLSLCKLLLHNKCPLVGEYKKRWP